MIPNTTPTPNIIFNGLMREMNDTEFRIVMLVVRATLGWEADKETGMRKVEDWMSRSQLKEKTGRQSSALSKAIDKCIKEKWIEARSKNGEILDTKGKRKGKNIYFRLGKSILFTCSESKQVIVTDPKYTSTCSESKQQPVRKEQMRKANTTKETILTKEINTKERESAVALTPAQNSRNFFDKFIKGDVDWINYIGNGWLEKAKQLSPSQKEAMLAEIKKFVSYWTEPNKSGTKVAWELKPTFDVGRRLLTWLSRSRDCNNFDKMKVSKKGFSLD